MILDTLLPAPEFRERHAVAIAASPAVVWRTLEELDFAALWLPRALMAIRSLPSRLTGRATAMPRRDRPLRLRELERVGFGILDERPGQEVVLGVTGPFWRPRANVLPFDRASHARPVPSGMARGLANFVLEPLPRGGTRLVTETRVVTGDPASRRRFRLYWLFVRPGSGLIRRSFLAAVRRRCERP